ncbi:MAG: YihY/virulence factor BrkB family protein, partial [Candidatus Eremiobacteraeota bacterium]|nr:YihY/virulence factor BrkB family protein [Candidatus Eremiobacteraeota bacterium]
FTTFAIAPLIIVVVQIVGFVLGQHHDTLHTLHDYLQQSAGRDAADGIQSIVTATFAQRHVGFVAQAISWVVFIFAAIGLFAALQQALNTIWDVQPEKQGWLEIVRSRALAFGVVLAIAFLLLVSLVVNSALTAAGTALQQVFPFFPTVMKVVDFVVSFAVITALFALLFEYLPECRIAWSDVWAGAVVSALLFVVGQFVLGWYLGRAGISSTYGAFGGLVVFLLWVNYSSQIMLFGAEFTHVYAKRHGSKKNEPSNEDLVPTVTGREPSLQRGGS